MRNKSRGYGKLKTPFKSDGPILKRIGMHLNLEPILVSSLKIGDLDRVMAMFLILHHTD